MPFRTQSLTVVLMAVASLALAGCNVSEHKNGHNDDVNIDVPFASMHVKTNDNAPASGIGLSVYPGAVAVKDDDKGSDSADVNMSFGDFHLGVKAASFQTGDSSAKVEAFYRKDMAKYGDVIKCQDGKAVGQPTQTADGLSCDSEKHGHHGGIVIDANDIDNKDNPELLTGSPQHEHVVSIEPKDGGTKIGLVMLDLPKDHHSDSQSE